MKTIIVPTGDGFACEVEITSKFEAECRAQGITLEEGAQQFVNKMAERKAEKANYSSMSRAERQAYNNQ